MSTKLAVSTALMVFGSIVLCASESTRLDAINVSEQSDKSTDLKTAKNTQAKNITEVLKQDVNINMGGGSPNTQRIYMRGLGEGLINATIDGAKQSKELHNHRGGTVGLDSDILKSISVNPGVSQADGGPGNLGGSIGFETVDAQDLLEQGKYYGAYIKSTLGSIDDSYKNSIALYGKIHEKIGILLYGSKADSENYKTGGGREVLSSAEELENYFVKLSILDLNSHTLRISQEKNTQEGLYKWGSVGSDMGYLTDENEAVRQKVIRETSILNYGYNPNDLVDVGLKLYQNNQDLENLDTNTKYTNKTIGVDLRNSFTLYNDFLRNKLTIGVDYEENKGKQKNGFREANDENRGLFIQNRMMFDSFTLSFGGRYDDYEQTIGHKKFSGNDVSPNINAEYFFTDNFSIFAGYGQAVSSTNLVPIGWLTGSGQVTYNGSVNGDLKTQKSEKYEIGTTFGFNNLVANSDNLDFKLTLFDTTIKNAISRIGGGPGSNPVHLINGKDIKTKGFEAKIGYALDKFRASLGYTHIDVKQDGTEISGTIKRTAASYGDRIVANLNYDVSNNLGFGYQLLGQLKNKNPSDNNVNNKAGYAVHNLNATYSPKEFKNLSFAIAINNLLDKDYASQTSLSSNGIAVGEPGRDVRVSFKYKF
ncbi:MAG: TonB-dependent receptor [Campylobacter sp.]|nr:TonB-dependent receptor [Campylobacter sp.]